MLAFTGCNHSLSAAESNELELMRNNTRHWREKIINGTEKRLQGECPMTPRRAQFSLRRLASLRLPRYILLLGRHTVKMGSVRFDPSTRTSTRIPICSRKKICGHLSTAKISLRHWTSLWQWKVMFLFTLMKATWLRQRKVIGDSKDSGRQSALTSKCKKTCKDCQRFIIFYCMSFVQP